VDFAEPIKYPFKDLKKLLIGGLLNFPGMILLLIPAIIATGYTIKAARDTVRGGDELPEFDNWSYFLIKGFGYFVINIAYMIILYATFIPAIALYFIGGSENVVFMILSTILGIAALIFAIILCFMAYIAFVRYGEKENIGAAFEFVKIFRNFKANAVNYIIGMIVMIALLVGISIVTFIATVTIVGILFMGVIAFYWQLVWMRMFAQIYKESKEKLGEAETL